MRNSAAVFWFSLIISAFFFFMFLFKGWPLLFFLFLPPIFWGFSKKDSSPVGEEIIFEEETPRYRFCPNCGHELVGFERYCPICGYKLVND